MFFLLTHTYIIYECSGSTLLLLSAEQVQEMVKYLKSVVDLLEAHFLDSWTPSSPHGSKRESRI